MQRWLLEELYLPLEDTFADCSYAYRPGRSIQQAVKHLYFYYQYQPQWIIKTDIKAFFDYLCWALLLHFVEQLQLDAQLPPLIDQQLRAGIKLRDRLELLTEGDYSRAELQQLTMLLLQTLRNSLSHEWVTTYLNAIRCGAGEVLEKILAQAQFLRLPMDMPVTVLDLAMPTFRLGEVVQWIAFDGDEAALMDWGIVVGKFYGYAPQSLRWMWCYLILLDPDSVAAQWGMIDTAWENELELWGD